MSGGAAAGMASSPRAAFTCRVARRTPRPGERSMATARRLSELLQEQQEPFLVVETAYETRRPRRGVRGGTGSAGACCPAAAAVARLLGLCSHGFKKRRSGGGLRSALGKVLCGRAAVRRVLRWEDLASGGCFSGAGGCGSREFRRLRRSIGDSDRRAMEFGEEGEGVRWKDDVEVDSSRQLSPVSVLELRSDDSPVHSPLPGDDDEQPSTSGCSPPSDAFLGPTSPRFTHRLDDRFCEMGVDAETVTRNGTSIEEQISSWEKIAGDISRIPSVMELDLRRSAPLWRERRPEVAEIGARIETLIFDDIRRETVRDMLRSHCTLAGPTSC